MISKKSSILSRLVGTCVMDEKKKKERKEKKKYPLVDIRERYRGFVLPFSGISWPEFNPPGKIIFTANYLKRTPYGGARSYWQAATVQSSIRCEMTLLLTFK